MYVYNTCIYHYGCTHVWCVCLLPFGSVRSPNRAPKQNKKLYPNKTKNTCMYVHTSVGRWCVCAVWVRVCLYNCTHILAYPHVIIKTHLRKNRSTTCDIFVICCQKKSTFGKEPRTHVSNNKDIWKMDPLLLVRSICVWEHQHHLPYENGIWRVMSHIWMSHVTRMNESCHTYDQHHLPYENGSTTSTLTQWVNEAKIDTHIMHWKKFKKTGENGGIHQNWRPCYAFSKKRGAEITQKWQTKFKLFESISGCITGMGWGGYD